MKLSLVLSLLIVSLPVFAEEEQAALFGEAKANALSNLDQRINHLTEAKSCVNAATDAAGLKSCRENLKGKMDSMRGEMKSKRAQLKGKREELVKGKKAEMQAKKQAILDNKKKK